jgi:hypothetical protein
VAAGRKQVFSRVAAARAAAAKADRLRVSRGRAHHASSPGGTSTAASQVAFNNTTALAVSFYFSGELYNLSFEMAQ